MDTFQIDLCLTDEQIERLAQHLDGYAWSNPQEDDYCVFNADSRLVVKLWSLGFQEKRDFWL